MHKFRYPNLLEAAQVGENGRELASGSPGPGRAAVVDPERRSADGGEQGLGGAERVVAKRGDAVAARDQAGGAVAAQVRGQVL